MLIKSVGWLFNEGIRKSSPRSGFQNLIIQRSGILVFILCITLNLAAQTTQFTHPQLRYNLLQIADQHARAGEWQDAILEYYQFIYRFPQDTLLPAIYYKIAAAYQQSGYTEQAEAALKKALQKSEKTAYQRESQLRWAVFLYEQGEYEKSLQYALQQSHPTFKIIRIYNLAMLGFPELADSLIRELGCSKYSVTEALHQIINHDDTAAQKRLWVKQWQSTLASALIPGLGQAFFDQYWDGAATAIGFYSLFKAAQGAARSNSDFFYIAATGLVYYYLGNLYATYQKGGQAAAQLRQQRIVRLLQANPLSALLGLAPALEIEAGLERSSGLEPN